VRSRVLAVAAFIAMAVVPAWLAWSTGVLPGPSEASAELTGPHSTSSQAITSIAWPQDPLGLAASGTRVYWEQRDPSASIAGVWYYDVTAGQVGRLLGRQSTGKASGFPAVAGDLVVWSSWASKRGVGTPSVQAYDGLSSRRWQVAAVGEAPTAADGLVIWAEPGAAGHGNDTIRGVNSLTDAEYAINANGSVRSLAASGRQLAWITDGTTNEVWAGSFKDGTRYRLAGRGTAVAVDRNRIMWATAVGRHSSAIVSWDRKKKNATVLCRLPGTSTSLTLSKRYAAWVTTRKATGPQVWVYDFGLHKAYQVSTAGGRQASPVIVDGSVYWAGDRTGHWELYARSLQH
jgi:hypothetical protein